MILAELFKKISYTHLSELSISGEGSGQIIEAHHPKMIQRINECLLALYARFPLRIRTIVIETYAALNEYSLRPEYALFSGSLEFYKYIIDTNALRFPNDVLMIESIVDEDGEPIGLDDANDDKSWHTISYDTLSIDAPFSGERFKIRYRAMPDEIVFGPWDDVGLVTGIKNQVIPIPRTLEAALLAFVAGHIYGNMSMEGALAKSQNFLDMYENECKIVEERNLLNSSPGNTNLKPQLNGWP